MQEPQFIASVWKFVHAPAHRVVPVAQPHTPALHWVAPMHLLVQKPQLSGSLAVSAQLLSAHCVVPVGQVATHAPEAQYGVAPEQTVPQAPQFIASDILLTQASPQPVSGALQTHAPAWHVERLLQSLLHAPQFFGSVCPLKHADTVELGKRQEICGNAHVAPEPPEPRVPPAGLPPFVAMPP
jgi:hypothetical protein